MKEKAPKTNAMRILDKASIPYTVYTYPHGKEAVDGIHVADALHQDYEQVFKTLLTISNTKAYFVFVIPVSHELDLKKAAKAVHMKAVEMIAVKDIQRVSGYIRGGCSPIGMKKAFPTCLHETCLQHDTIMFSGGQIGCQIAMSPKALLNLINASCADIIQ